MGDEQYESLHRTPALELSYSLLRSDLGAVCEELLQRFATTRNPRAA
jgi:hypothetical protein